MAGSQKLWVLPGQDRGQWLLLQLPRNTLPGTVMNLALQALRCTCCAHAAHMPYTVHTQCTCSV